jgi:hypothetical protein
MTVLVHLIYRFGVLTLSWLGLSTRVSRPGKGELTSIGWARTSTS